MSHDERDAETVRQIREAAHLPSVDHVIDRHLDQVMDANARLAPRRSGRPRHRVFVLAAAAAAILLVPTLAFAGGLPAPLQRLAVKLGDAVGVSVPRSSTDIDAGRPASPSTPTSNDATLDATRTDGREEDMAEPGIHLVVPDGDADPSVRGGSRVPGPGPAAEQGPGAGEPPIVMDPSGTRHDPTGTSQAEGADDVTIGTTEDEIQPDRPANPNQEKPRSEQPKPAMAAPGEDEERGTPHGNSDDDAGDGTAVQAVGNRTFERIAAPVTPPGRAPA